MSIETEITRIKTNIASAYTKAKEKGATLPEVQNSANLPATIESITGGSSEEWQPEPDWWDIDKILEEDEEDYPTKMIWLVDDSKDIFEIKNANYGIFKSRKIKTSDGATYYNNGSYFNDKTGITHTWNTSYDKECSLGYKTRYVIFYFDNEIDFGSYSFENVNEIIYFIVDNAQLNFGNVSYSLPNLKKCECVKYRNCKYINAAFRIYDMFNLKRFLLENTEIVNDFIEFNTTFKNCYKLNEKDINDLLNKFYISKECTANELFNNCNNIKNINFNNPEKITSYGSAFTNCTQLISVNNNILKTDSCTMLNNSFNNCIKMKKIEFSNTSLVTNFTNLFYNCISLKEVKNLNLIVATNINNMFYKCCALKDLTISNILISGIDFSTCINLSHDSLINILNALYDYSGNENTHTIALGATNLAKLTDEELKIGQDKGWTIS